MTTEMLIALALLGVAVAIALLNDRWKARGRGGASDSSRSLRKPATSTPPWLWLALIVGSAVLFWGFTPKNRAARRPGQPGPAGGLLCAGLLFAAVGYVAVAYLRASFRYYDRGVNRAIERANAGDLDGALADLRRDVEEKGPSVNRANAIAVLLGGLGKWDDVIAVLREAEACGGGSDPVNRTNLAWALWRSGREEEALPYLRRAAEVSPRDINIGCHLCNLLADLGRWDEAREVFARVEEDRKMTYAVVASHRKLLDDAIEACRVRLARKPEGPKGPPLDEL